MARVLLDTDTLSEILKGKNAAVAAKASALSRGCSRRLWPMRRCCHSMTTRRGSQDESMPTSNATSNASGVIGLPDVMISAIAIRNGLAIVTGNTAHFEQVRAAKYDLFIDNWRLA
jgi:tRNA(fMet)-specific endonuclease VapC